MAALIWDEVGKRLFETGLDRGVLYLEDGSGVAWNGLTSIEEDLSDATSTPYHFEGIKYLDQGVPGDYSGSLKAITYPEEFGEYEGSAELEPGLFVENQFPKRFGLSYRTLIGNDLEGTDYAYKIHLLYNLVAAPDTKSFVTMGSSTQLTEFAWKIAGVGPWIDGYRPTAHLIIDSRTIDPMLLKSLETTLYGDDTTNPRLPSLAEVLDWRVITITNNGDGTWSATGPEELITMLDPNTFQITQANAIFLDPDTYQISSSEE